MKDAHPTSDTHTCKGNNLHSEVRQTETFHETRQLRSETRSVCASNYQNIIKNEVPSNEVPNNLINWIEMCLVQC